jgi:hypothetical protein
MLDNDFIIKGENVISISNKLVDVAKKWLSKFIF